MTQRTASLLFLVLSCFAISQGCRTKGYVVGVKNATVSPLDGVLVSWNDQRFSVGFLAPGAEAAWLDAPDPPRGGMVSWTTPDGTGHQVECRAPTDLHERPGEDTEVWFDILDNDHVAFRQKDRYRVPRESLPPGPR